VPQVFLLVTTLTLACWGKNHYGCGSSVPRGVPPAPSSRLFVEGGSIVHHGPAGLDGGLPGFCSRDLTKLSARRRSHTTLRLLSHRASIHSSEHPSARHFYFFLLFLRQPCYAAQAGLELEIVLPAPPPWGGHRPALALPVASLKVNFKAGCQWLTPVIPATQEAEIRRIKVQSQSGQVVLRTPS
jgi:hypothetical protein